MNRKCKYCCRVYYEAKVKDLRDQKSLHCWQEVKLLCGTGKRSRRDPTVFILADLVNEALKYCARVPSHGEQPVNVSTSRAGSPDDLPNWMLKEFADVFRGTQRRCPP